jgi:N-acetyl-alpha-D-muramate 1-phosphate uridylyltransferase
MRGMILAAGRGERMGALTEKTPKPLLKVKERYLIEYSIDALKKINIRDIVINVCYQREQIKLALGDGSRYGVHIHYSDETEALETGGGIFQALPLLGDDPFVVLSCDVVTDYPLQKLPKNLEQLAHLVLVDNPDFHPKGDFCFAKNSEYLEMPNQNSPTFTFGNIGVYRKELFQSCSPGKFRLGDLLKQYILQNQVTGECYSGFWHNVGNPEQLVKLSEEFVVLRNMPETISDKK